MCFLVIVIEFRFDYNGDMASYTPTRFIPEDLRQGIVSERYVWILDSKK